MASFANSHIGRPLHDEVSSGGSPSRPSPLATPAGEIRHDIPLDAFVGEFSRATMRTRITRDSDGLVVHLEGVPEELVGARTELQGMVTEFRAAPISENTLVSRGELIGGPQALTFHRENRRRLPADVHRPPAGPARSGLVAPA